MVGLTEDAARALLGGFTINIQQAPDAHIPVGRVASQLPLATSRVPQGSSVTLTISQGPGNVTIPVDLVGKTLSQARDELASAGLVITQTIPEDSNQAPGTVLKVIPDAGSIIPAGSGITLQIASGNLAIPNLVGMSEIQAKTILAQAGLLVKTIYATDKTQGANVVLAQAPNAGTTQSIGSSITITVNQLPTN